MEFRVLGPLEVRDGGGTLSVGGPRQRLVLALLLLDAGRVVPADVLIDRIWDDEPPDAAREALSAYVSRLRKVLGAARLEPRPPGYVLLADRAEVDASRFEDALNDARGAQDADSAHRLLTSALELWRGGAFADLADHDALQPAIARLDALRQGALEDRAAAELDLGRHRDALPTLEALVREHPLRERVWGLLMLALYRSGRQGDALAAYHRARAVLGEELGIDPSPELQRMYDRILQQDPTLEIALAQPPTAAVDSAVPPPRPPSGGIRRLPRRPLAVAVAGGIVVLAALWAMRDSPSLPATEWTIGVDLPLSGPAASHGLPVLNAVQLAIDEFNREGGIQGSTLRLDARDDMANPELAAENAAAFAADPTVIAMVGPWGSNATFGALPVTNEAGLLECSPASTHPGLTKPRDGALDLRAANPEVINFVRLPPADDIQAVALASFAYHDLEARYALVIDDTGVGRVIADPFEREFAELGGVTLRRALNPGTDPRSLLSPLADELNPPDLVFFGGEPDTGGIALRRAMAEAGRLSTPFLSWDPLLDGDGADPGSFIGQLGVEAAVGSYVAHASLPDSKASFTDAYRAAYDAEPDEYAAAGYACVEIIIAAMRAIAPSGPSADQVRELVRAYAADPAHRFETILGTVGFDANGDAVQQFVTFYRVEASAADGSGDWVIFKKQDYGPAP